VTILVYICVYNMRMCIYICMVCMVGPADPSAARCSGEVRLLGAVAAITLWWTGWRGPTWSFGGGRERKVWKGEIT
jgi:hypothetical protein